MVLIIRLGRLVRNHKKMAGSRLITRYSALILNCLIARIQDLFSRDWLPKLRQNDRLKRSQSKKLAVLFKQSHFHLGHGNCQGRTHHLNSPQILQFKRYLLESYRQSQKETRTLYCLRTTFINEKKVNPWLYQSESHRLTNRQIFEKKKR